MEHTPKNLLIRAVKSEKNEKTENEKLQKMLDTFTIHPTLEKLLEAQKEDGQ